MFWRMNRFSRLMNRNLPNSRESIVTNSLQDGASRAAWWLLLMKARRLNCCCGSVVSRA
jgi:hypothetical protein